MILFTLEAIVFFPHQAQDKPILFDPTMVSIAQLLVQFLTVFISGFKHH